MDQPSPRFASNSREWVGKLRNEDLDGRRLYVCSKCLTHVADHEDILSKVSRNVLLSMVSLIAFRAVAW